jgi:hypothetical protein
MPNDSTKTWRAQHEKYRTYKTGHDRLLEVTAEIKRALNRRNEGIIIVAGPTRVGKTTLLAGVINSILSDNLAKMEEDPGFLPAAWMEAYAYKRGYKWSDHWYGCLEAVNEPLINHKSAGYNIVPDRDARHASASYKYEREDILRRSFEDAAKHRRIRVFGVDEAQSIVVGSSRDMHRANVEVIKSVANTSKALHILCGNYDVLDLFNLSGQIGARTGRPIHFSRYSTARTKDLMSFAAVAEDLTSKMPVSEPPRFTEILDYLIDRSLGLIGLLKIWFSDALGDVLENGRKTITRDDLEKHEPPEEVLDRVSKEIIIGEHRLEQDGSKFALIRARMQSGAKFDERKWKEEQYNRPKDNDQSTVAPPTPLARPEVGSEPRDSVPDKNPATKKPRGNSKPFERAPVRDKVGQGRNKRVA